MEDKKQEMEKCDCGHDHEQKQEVQQQHGHSHGHKHHGHSHPEHTHHQGCQHDHDEEHEHEEHEHHHGCQHDHDDEHHHHHEEKEGHSCNHNYVFPEEGTEEYKENLNFMSILREHMPPMLRKAPENVQQQWLQHMLIHFREQLKREEETEKEHGRYKEIIRDNYKHRHPHLLKIDQSFFQESFWNAIRSGSKEALMSILKQESKGIYSFDMLKPDYCRELLEEIENFENWCSEYQMKVLRPNSMNNYGAILDDFGFYAVIQEWVQRFIEPISSILFPELGQHLDDHHGFVVEYKVGKDEKLDFHIDDSEVTLNVCLGKEFTGGNLFFRGMRCGDHQQTPIKVSEAFDLSHVPGKAIIHIGRHRHGARQIKSGERFNLIIWCKSQGYRKDYETNVDHEHMKEYCGWDFQAPPKKDELLNETD